MITQDTWKFPLCGACIGVTLLCLMVWYLRHALLLLSEFIVLQGGLETKQAAWCFRSTVGMNFGVTVPVSTGGVEDPQLPLQWQL